MKRMGLLPSGSHSVRCSAWSQSSLCDHVFFCLGPKSPYPPARLPSCFCETVGAGVSRCDFQAPASWEILHGGGAFPAGFNAGVPEKEAYLLRCPAAPAETKTNRFLSGYRFGCVGIRDIV